MSRTGRLLRDIGLFSIASLVPKALGFLLTPLYTSALSPEAFGGADLYNSIEAVILPILMLDISDAVLIYTVEYAREGHDKATPLRFADMVLIAACGICAVACAVTGFLAPDFVIACVYVFAKFALDASYYNVLAYLRGSDQVGVIVETSVVGSVAVIVANVLMVLVLDWGMIGLLAATVVGQAVSNAYAMLRSDVREARRASRAPTPDEGRAMLRYSVPLILTGIAWWANSASDRLFVSILAGVAANGMYAVAARIPGLLTVVHSVLYQALQLSVFGENQAEDRADYYERLYGTYAFCICAAASVVILLARPLAMILFRGEFFGAWVYVPGLVLGMAAYSISGYLTTILSAVKRTSSITVATVAGALVNLILNIALIGPYGVWGAVVATAIGYVVVWAFMAMEAMRVAGVVLPVARSVVCFTILAVQWCVYVQGLYVPAAIAPIAMVAFNRSSVGELMSAITRFASSMIANTREG